MARRRGWTGVLGVELEMVIAEVGIRLRGDNVVGQVLVTLFSHSPHRSSCGRSRTELGGMSGGGSGAIRWAGSCTGRVGGGLEGDTGPGGRDGGSFRP